MKSFCRSVLITSLLLVFSVLKAQQNHFIYLQTENRQPFYVKMDKVIYNSTISGYLIIPKLKDGEYNFIIGFVGTDNEEQKMACSVANADAGYLVKKFGDKGWGLFNLQTLQVTMSANAAKEQSDEKNVAVKSDDFSQMLSTVVNDPAIKYEEKAVSVVKVEKKDTVLNEKVVSVDSGATKVDSLSLATQATDKAQIPSLGLTAVSIRRSNLSTDNEGLKMVYIDSADKKVDTISILIPLFKDPLTKVDSAKEKSASLLPDTQKDEKKDFVKKEDNQEIISVPHTKQEPVRQEEEKIEKKRKNKDRTENEAKADDKFLNIEMPVGEKTRKDSIQISSEKKSIAESESTTSSTSTCINYSTESDFLKLRKKMASANSEEDMLKAAKKAFKSKCYTTDQVKNLGVLFLNDAARYNFFDTAYTFVSDPNNFNQLQDQLIDQYYKNRFKAMLRQ